MKSRQKNKQERKFKQKWRDEAEFEARHKEALGRISNYMAVYTTLDTIKANELLDNPPPPNDELLNLLKRLNCEYE